MSSRAITRRFHNPTKHTRRMDAVLRTKKSLSMVLHGYLKDRKNKRKSDSATITFTVLTFFYVFDDIDR